MAGTAAKLIAMYACATPDYVNSTVLTVPVRTFHITFKCHFSIKNAQNSPVTFKCQKLKEQVNQMGYLIMNQCF